VVGGFGFRFSEEGVAVEDCLGDVDGLASGFLVSVRGELDELNAAPLEQTLVAHTNGSPLIVDPSAVTFICSASIRVLLADRPYGRPALVAPEGVVRRVLDIVDVNRTNKLFYDQQTALQSLCLTDLARTG
jgi:anti-anti-sigma regulatory factor